jgi:hypothetical protein
MFSASLVNVLLQVIAAVVICFVGYLSLMLCALVGLVLAKLIYKAARFVWFRMISRVISTNILTANVGGHAHIVPHA